MRKQLIEYLISRADDPSLCFLTGDLGFALLEPLREKLGQRFVNCGIAEQNMISVAAGLARKGFTPWVYTIAPFCYARALESIRIDVALHSLPVRLIGAGGGYAYGIQGPTHHALEDFAVLNGLQNLEVYAPAFQEDVVPLAEMLPSDRPVYLRLCNRQAGEKFVAPPYRHVRFLPGGNPDAVLFLLGDLAQYLLPAIGRLRPERRPGVCVCCRLPVSPDEFPAELLDLLRSGRAEITVVEEHVRHGGLGEALALLMMENTLHCTGLRHRYALGYPAGEHGTREFYWRQSALDAESVLSLF